MACDWVKSSREKVVRAVFEKLDRMEIPKNAAFVFDIDHTLIDETGMPIEPVVQLFHTVKKLGIHPVIITARTGTPEVIKWTQDQLKHFGITGQKFTYLLSPGKTDPWKYKHIARKNVHERGLHVIMSIGDQPWDLGEYGGIGFQLPRCDSPDQFISQYFG